MTDADLQMWKEHRQMRQLLWKIRPMLEAMCGAICEYTDVSAEVELLKEIDALCGNEYTAPSSIANTGKQ